MAVNKKAEQSMQDEMDLELGRRNLQSLEKQDRKFKPDISKESDPNIKVTYDANKGKKKKDPIVSEKEFKEFNKSGGKTLRDFMNAKQYDEATGKFVDRAKALTRRKDKRPDVKALPATYSAKKGGSVSSRGDGIAQRGKTRA